MGHVDLRYHRGDEILWLAVWAQEGLWSKEDVRVISFRHRKSWNDARLREYKGTQYPMGNQEGE